MDLPVLVGPTIRGVLVVLAGPRITMDRTAVASSNLDRLLLFFSKNIVAA